MKKQFKKTIKARPVLSYFGRMALIFLCFALSLSLFGCGQPQQEAPNDDDVIDLPWDESVGEDSSVTDGYDPRKDSFRLVIGNDDSVTEYAINLDAPAGNTVLDALNYLKSRGSIEFEYTLSTYGAYVHKVGHIEEKPAEGRYVYFWTSNSADFDVSAYATEKSYDGQTLVSAGVGVSEMTFEKGTVIYVGETVY